jgi:hypothetical protein
MKAWTMLASLLCAAMPVFAQTGQEWPVTMQQTAGNTTTCSPGGKGKIQVKDGEMALLVGGSQTPNWKIKLAADGSFDAVAPAAFSRGGVKVTVPAGNGPRAINTVQQSQVCSYRIIPG